MSYYLSLVGRNDSFVNIHMAKKIVMVLLASHKLFQNFWNLNKHVQTGKVSLVKQIGLIPIDKRGILYTVELNKGAVVFSVGITVVFTAVGLIIYVPTAATIASVSSFRTNPRIGLRF